MKFFLLIPFLFIFFNSALAYSVDLNVYDHNLQGVSDFVVTIDCSKGFLSEFGPGDIVDYSLWHCSTSAECNELLSGNFLFEEGCFVQEFFSVSVNDVNVGLFFFDKKHYETEWNLRSEKFFYDNPLPLLFGSSPAFVFEEVPEPSLFWLFYLGIGVVFVGFLLLTMRKKSSFLFLALGFVLVIAGVLLA